MHGPYVRSTISDRGKRFGSQGATRVKYDLSSQSLPCHSRQFGRNLRYRIVWNGQ
jgi:hypothetical protein